MCSQQMSAIQVGVMLGNILQSSCDVFLAVCKGGGEEGRHPMSRQKGAHGIQRIARCIHRVASHAAVYMDIH